MPATYRAQGLRLSIRQVTSFHRELPIAYDRTELTIMGEPLAFNFTWPPPGWTARLDLFDAAETLVVSFATSGEDGLITLTLHGEVDLYLDDTFTAALPATVEIAGVVHAPIYGQLVFTSPAGVPYDGPRVTAEIVRSPEP